jgi:hypothetical protein
MSDDLGKSLEWSCRDPVTHEPIDDGDYSNATVSEVKQAIAEITRLRAELATARREGMEDAAKIVIARGWRHERLAAAIRAAAGEVK